MEVTRDVRSWDACSRRCYERVDCKYFTWHHGNAGYYKYQCMTMSDASSYSFDNNCISGNHHCGGELMMIIVLIYLVNCYSDTKSNIMPTGLDRQQ